MSFFQGLLNGVGAVLAWLYALIPNYGVAIIILTLAIRVLLLPLAIKQIRSMQAMQAIAPKQKELQRKYKGNRQKIQEETMRLYKEEGVNPLGGCLPLLLQFPVLITLFYVLQFPKGMTHIPHSSANRIVGEPQDSKLFVDIAHQKTRFLGMNLLCSPAQAGTQVTVNKKAIHVPDAPPKLDCGSGAPVRIPYYIFLAAMVATTYYQQKQMQRASPAQNPQQQMLTRIMPLFFGFIGFNFPAGLVVYWTTTNLVQIGQQQYMLPKPPEAGARPEKARGDGGKAAPRDKRTGPSRLPGKGGSKGPVPGGRQPRPQSRDKAPGEGGKSPVDGEERQGAGGGGPSGSGNRTGRSPGGRDGGDRKKRRKR